MKSILLIILFFEPFLLFSQCVVKKNLNGNDVITTSADYIYKRSNIAYIGINISTSLTIVGTIEKHNVLFKYVTENTTLIPHSFSLFFEDKSIIHLSSIKVSKASIVDGLNERSFLFSLEEKNIKTLQNAKLIKVIINYPKSVIEIIVEDQEIFKRQFECFNKQ